MQIVMHYLWTNAFLVWGKQIHELWPKTWFWACAFSTKTHGAYSHGRINRISAWVAIVFWGWIVRANKKEIISSTGASLVTILRSGSSFTVIWDHNILIYSLLTIHWAGDINDSPNPKDRTCYLGSERDIHKVYWCTDSAVYSATSVSTQYSQNAKERQTRETGSTKHKTSHSVRVYFPES